VGLVLTGKDVCVIFCTLGSEIHFKGTISSLGLLIQVAYWKKKIHIHIATYILLSHMHFKQTYGQIINEFQDIVFSMKHGLTCTSNKLMDKL